MHASSGSRCVVSRAAWIWGIGVLLALPGFAQESPPEAGTDAGAVEEIIVTSTKREQSIQDVPIAVSAYQGEELLRRGVADLQDLAKVSPSLFVSSSSSNTNGGTIRIRGMGTSGNNPGLESAVGVFIDGVFRSRAGLAFQDLVDIERVEVLKGPQGTLFGKNTSAGAVHVLTRRPSFEWGGHLTGTGGNFDARRLEGSLTGPLVEELLAFRVAGSWHERDGYFEQANGSGESFDRNRHSVRGQLLWTPSPDFDLRLIADYSQHDEKCCSAGYELFNTTDTLPPASVPPGTALRNTVPGTVSQSGEWEDLEHGFNRGPTEDFDDWGISAEANWTLPGEITLTALGSYRRSDIFRTVDPDFSDADLLKGNSTEEVWKAWSGELRLAGRQELLHGLDWMLGLYVSGEDVQNDLLRQSEVGFDASDFIGNLIAPLPVLTAAFAEGQFNTVDFGQEAKTASLFTHDTLGLTDRLDLSVGARFTWEEKKARKITNDQPTVDPSNPDLSTLVNPPLCLEGSGFELPLIALRQTLGGACDNLSWSDSYHNTDWSLFGSFLFRLSEEHNVYASYSRGFKSGGWNANSDSLSFFPLGPAAGPFPFSRGALGGVISDGRQFDPEFSNNIELGLKSRMLGGALRLNATLFHTTFKGYQLQTFTGQSFFINNVPRVKSRGVELELFSALTSWLFLQGGVTYADTRFGDNLFIPDIEEREGERLPQAPAWSGSVGLLLDLPLFDSGWTLLGSTNLQYRGRNITSADLDSRKEQGHFTRSQVRLGLRSPSGRWEITAFGENLEDDVQGNFFDSPLQNGNISAFPSSPRFYGLTVRLGFGE